MEINRFKKISGANIDLQNMKRCMYNARERCGYLVEQLCYGFPAKGARYYESSRKKVVALPDLWQR
jgi:hypothetical protein